MTNEHASSHIRSDLLSVHVALLALLTPPVTGTVECAGLYYNIEFCFAFVTLFNVLYFLFLLFIFLPGIIFS